MKLKDSRDVDSDSARSTMPLTQTVPLLYVTDMKTSLEFYISGLGFQVMHKWGADQDIEWCWLQQDGATLMLQQAESPEEVRGSDSSVMLFFLSDDLTAFHHLVSQCGVDVTPIESAFYGMRQFFVNDPDQYRICFEQPFASDDELA